MKHKKSLFFLVLCLLIYLIYTLYHDDKINYLALGDSLTVGVNAYGEVSYGYSDYVASYLERNKRLKTYSKDFALAGSRISDLLHQLETNQIIDNLSLKKCLREADLVTLSIGGNDLLSEISLSTKDVETLNEEEIINIFNRVVTNLEDLYKQLRKYNNRKIIMIGYYNPNGSSTLSVDRLFTYLDDKITKISKKYDIKYISLYNLFKENKEYLPNPTNIHPSIEGYEAISRQVIVEIKDL